MTLARPLFRSLARHVHTTPRRLTPLPKAEINPAHKGRIAVGTEPGRVAHTPDEEPVIEAIVPIRRASVVSPVVEEMEVRMPPPPPAPAPEPPAPTPVARVKRPVGGFRGGLIGLLLGTSLVGGYGYMYLLEDYTQASQLLLMSVEELKQSTEAMTTHIKRIERVESELAQVVKTAAGKKDVESLRAEYRKLIDGSHLDHLDLKAHLWGVEQDVHALTKKAATEVRI